MNVLQSFARRIVGNRRRHKRKPIVYKTTLVDELGQSLFQGKTLDISRSGARIIGLPYGPGPALNQLVKAEFLVIPREASKRAFKASVPAYICRIEDNEDDFILAIKFNQFLRT
ncbi:MAG: PilZ domain-containing protein [Planctomycetota bacterium]|nr:PilZ domain-containing protein [Planctomycetota bacterium]